jgi:AraC family transcriptional regulator
MVDHQLRVEIFTGRYSPDPTAQTLKQQYVAKVLKPGELEVGLRPESLVKYRYAPGDIVICRQHTEEWVRSDNAIEMLMVALPDEANRSLELHETPRLEDARISALMTALEAERHAGFLSGRLYLDGIGQALSAALLQACGISRKLLSGYRGGLAPVQLRRVTEFVQEHLDQDLSLAQLAETVSLSPAHFSQVFRQSIGARPHQFVLRARVERAKNILRNPQTRILDVALACGFQTQQHFARVFRALCSVSPREYRREHSGNFSTKLKDVDRV